MLVLLLVLFLFRSHQMDLPPSAHAVRQYFCCDPYLHLDSNEIIRNAVIAKETNRGKPLWLDLRNYKNLYSRFAEDNQSKFALIVFEHFYLELPVLKKATIMLRVTSECLPFLIQPEWRPVWMEYLHAGKIPSMPYAWLMENLEIDDFQEMLIKGYIPTTDDYLRFAIRSGNHHLFKKLVDDIYGFTPCDPENPAVLYDVNAFGDDLTKKMFASKSFELPCDYQPCWKSLKLNHWKTGDIIDFSKAGDIFCDQFATRFSRLDKESARLYVAYLVHRNFWSKNNMDEFYDRVVQGILVNFMTICDPEEVFAPYQDFITMTHLIRHGTSSHASKPVVECLMRILIQKGRFDFKFSQLVYFKAHLIPFLIEEKHFSQATFQIWHELSTFDRNSTELDEDTRKALI